jgi:hypothetical protein
MAQACIGLYLDVGMSSSLPLPADFTQVGWVLGHIFAPCLLLHCHCFLHLEHLSWLLPWLAYLPLDMHIFHTV